MFNIFKEIERVTEAYLAAEGIAIPESIRKDTERDEREPDRYVADNHQMTRDQRLDDPRHGQCRRGRFAG